MEEMQERRVAEAKEGRLAILKSWIRKTSLASLATLLLPSLAHLPLLLVRIMFAPTQGAKGQTVIWTPSLERREHLAIRGRTFVCSETWRFSTLEALYRIILMPVS